jgi:hypothetical protein
MVVTVKAVEMHESTTETTADVVQSPPSRRKTACASPPGIDSNVISEALQMTISTSGSSGAPSTCSSPPATRIASIAGFNSENTTESSHKTARNPRCAVWTMTVSA